MYRKNLNKSFAFKVLFLDILNTGILKQNAIEIQSWFKLNFNCSAISYLVLSRNTYVIILRSVLRDSRSSLYVLNPYVSSSFDYYFLKIETW